MEVREPKDWLMHALDYRNGGVAVDMAINMRSFTSPICKVGHGLMLRCGPPILRTLQMTFGFGVFLDEKFHDTPETVFEASVAATELGVRMFTVDCEAGEDALKAARQAVDETAGSGVMKPTILGVIMLTSKKPSDFERDGLMNLNEDAPARAYVEVFEEVVMRRALMATEVGMDGLVVSPRFVKYVRRACPKALIVTPGIHAIETAYQAVREGADYLVIGRLFRQSKKPHDVARELLRVVGEAIPERRVTT